MSPANVYRFFESKKAIHQAVARGLMDEVELEAQRIVARPKAPSPRILFPVLRFVEPQRDFPRPPPIPTDDKDG
jgi:AcrR family transcriptional regulator